MLGCHPHTWSPPKQVIAWRCSQDGVYEKSSVSHECFITHNGDMDAFRMGSTVYELSDLQRLLPALLHTKLPAGVDSMVVAGLMELLRTRGDWRSAARRAYAFDVLGHAVLNPKG